jgi:hypothetical protein
MTTGFGNVKEMNVTTTLKWALELKFKGKPITNGLERY